MDRSLDASAVLRVWELGRRRHAIDRALLVLAATYPETPPDGLATLTIGERDTRLLEVRSVMFGPGASAVATCPVCSADVEFTIDDLRAGPAAHGIARTFDAEAHGHRLTLRALDSYDLAEAVRCADVDEARDLLARRAVVAATHGGVAVPPEDLPAAVIDAVGPLVAEHDPGADVTVDLTCPECAHPWESPLDPITFLWAEVDACARRLFHEIHALARAYGWTEADVLALTPERRQSYVELVGSDR